MIDSKESLRVCLETEKRIYFNEINGSALKNWVMSSKHWKIWRYIHILRVSEYHMNSGHKFRFAIYHRKKHKLGNKIGFEIPENCVDQGLAIYHIAPIIINGEVRIGKNMSLSGNFCAGHKNPGEGAPIIGDNVYAGWGSCVIGNVSVADGVNIGAGAVVVNDIVEAGVGVAGVPAKILR